MPDVNRGGIDWTVPTTGNARAEIADRRARYAARVAELTGMSMDEATNVFTTLPSSRHERRGRIRTAAYLGIALGLLPMAAPTALPAQSTSLGLHGGTLTPVDKNPDVGGDKAFTNDLVLTAGLRFILGGK